MVAVVLAVTAGPLRAEAPDRSQRPVPRPAAAIAADPPAPAVAPVTVAGGIGKSLRPQPKPAGAQATDQAQVPTPAAPVPVAVTVAVAGPATLRPAPRPALAAPQAAPEAAAPGAAVTASAAPPARPPRRGLFGLFGRNGDAPRDPAPRGGYVCGDPDIRGEELARITSRTRGCGVEEPVQVTSISGIRLSTPAIVDCQTAAAFKTWIDRGLRPAFRREIVEIQIAASYICRPRNNIRGNRISEHGRGKAVDISGLVFADGRSITVADGYNREFRRAHRAACGIFGTTLGPGSDGYHEDHLHFDTASHRSGPYCR
ncbi:MAG: hypothetical protein RIR62_107 [Pseudomonadota bacterium]|jgi:hypothetical protein